MEWITTAVHLPQRVTVSTGTTSPIRREDLSTTSTIEVAVGMAREARMVVQVASTMVAQRETRVVVTIVPGVVMVEDGKPQKDFRALTKRFVYLNNKAMPPEIERHR